MIKFKRDTDSKFFMAVRERPASYYEYYYASTEQELKEYLRVAFDDVFEATIEELE